MVVPSIEISAHLNSPSLKHSLQIINGSNARSSARIYPFEAIVLLVLLEIGFIYMEDIRF